MVSPLRFGSSPIPIAHPRPRHVRKDSAYGSHQGGSSASQPATPPSRSMSPLSWLHFLCNAFSPFPPSLTAEETQKLGREFLNEVRKLHPPKNAGADQVKPEDIARLNAILKQGLSVDYQDRSGQTAVMVAAYNGHLPLVRFLVEQKKADLHLTDRRDGFNALHSAIGGTHEVKEGQEDPHNQVAEYLLERGIDFKARVGSWQNTALGMTAQRGNIPMLQKLMAKYVEQGGEDAKLEALAQTNKLGDMPLHNAAGAHQIDAASILIEEGTPVDAVNPVNGNTPAHRAAIIGDKDMLILLYKNKADMGIRNKAELIPRDVAMNHRHWELAGSFFMAPKLPQPDIKQDQETGIFQLDDGNDLQESAASSKAFRIPRSS